MNYRHDKVNANSLKSHQRLAIELTDTQIALEETKTELGNTLFALKEVFGKDGLERVKKFIQDKNFPETED